MLRYNVARSTINTGSHAYLAQIIYFIKNNDKPGNVEIIFVVVPLLKIRPSSINLVGLLADGRTEMVKSY